MKAFVKMCLRFKKINICFLNEQLQNYRNSVGLLIDNFE